MAKEEIVHTKYEKARILGSRALQIAMGAPILLKLKEEQLKEMKFNPIEIAKKEYEEGLIPISVKRSKPQIGLDVTMDQKEAA